MNSTLITSKHGYEIWARWDKDAQVYELFFEEECESYTGSVADTLEDAQSTARYILEEQMCEQHDWNQRKQNLLDDA
jgi:hypothetical protein